MGVDTYLLIPTSSPARARRDFDESELVKVGRDYVVLYESERFATVREDPEAWGAEYHATLPRWLRRELDPRGLAAIPEAGRVPEESDYADALRAIAAPLFLPVKRSRAKTKPRRRGLLVELSSNRERLLRADPELVRRLVSAVAERDRVVPDSIEVDGGGLGRALSGLPLYEDERVESARLLPVERVRAIAASASCPMSARKFYEGAAARGRAVLAVRFRA